MKSLLAAASIAIFMGCSGPNLEKSTAWLDSHQETSTLNMAGAWRETSGWSEASFSQTGSKIMGVMGRYNFEGRVSGNRVYGVLVSGKRVYYYMVLEQDNNGAFTGSAIYRAEPESKAAQTAERYPVILVRPKSDS